MTKQANQIRCCFDHTRAPYFVTATHLGTLLCKLRHKWLLVFVLCFGALHCKADSLAPASGKLDMLTISATALVGNGVATDAKQQLMVYLPPGYQKQPSKPYPVVYWLLDFNQGIYAIKSLKQQLDLWFAKPSHQAFVLVAVTGTNQFGGSFYLNSSLTGDWQDYLLWDVPSQVAQQLAVRNDPSGVAWVGFGMGGLAAMNLGLQYPSQASRVAALSPMLMQTQLMKQFLPLIPRPILHAYSAVVTPVAGETYGVLPQFNDSQADLDIQQAWYAGMANWEQKMALFFREYPESDILLGCGSGSSPGFKEGCEALHQMFNQAYLDHQYITYSGSPEAIWQAQFKQSVLPWLQQKLKF
ncbi:alpha/beta hydrolase-fold protein [Motilimonas eburnea]|uniref:alpha/beta hydrolase-fold protein n=1 Tax=Motilimonas eburnea TaxID=1737488 RepID=UPI001E381AD9|nr:alpha/beta hydrolase-fold protein [Motilimonas eburnea]MCE2572403.1 esterase family protein [Motilimonas eburnea]